MVKELICVVLTAVNTLGPLNRPDVLSTESREINEQMEEQFHKLQSITGTQKKLQAKISHLQKLEAGCNDSHLQKLNRVYRETEQEKARLTDSMEQLAVRQNEIRQELNIPEMDPDQGSMNTAHMIRDDQPAYLRQALPESSGSVSGGLLGKGFACSVNIPDSFASSSKSLLLPADGYRSAGTWAYPGGGTHLGLDLASALYTPVKAPADGIILYAGNPSPSNNGYLGNYAGWPAGGGNTIAMLCRTEDKLYGVTFAHLSNQFYVKPGMQIFQGTVLALSGNSGNSTGPHTHIEVFEMKVPLSEALAFFGENADFSFGCGWTAPGSCSPYACRIRPESVFH
ncbi:MAG: peptidoglycan DD-metalloendopeptidase family protein [Erysipelotrichaceae bacterium]|nr:peptidoglycan DD-metalloendopeptidase family protein [Erysipelotrichaceae bacterium]